MYNLNFLLVLSTVVVQAKSVGERENVFEKNRFETGLETCIENFDVHIDKIIRTQDSRAMGAKYLNEADMNSKEDCMKLCCETPTCDVFVFEQKVPGSCYLFHCGSPEDFKCKFSQHRNYTSAVLTLNNRLSELENRKLTKHEEELNMLRKMDSDTTTFAPLSTKVPASPLQPKQNLTKIQCSRYQFECRGSGECIAIYNVCDGIPQCSDGSDEAIELYCPYITGTPHPKTFHEQLKNLKGKNEKPQPDKLPEVSASVDPLQKVQQPLTKPLPTKQHDSISSGYFPYGYSQPNEQTMEASHTKIDPPKQLPNQFRFYGREGEMVQYPIGGMQWQGYQNQIQDESNHLFNHKGNGIIPDTSDSQYPGPYNNDISRAEYLKYGSNNGYFGGSGPIYYPGFNNWPQRVPQQIREENQQRPLMSMYGNGMSGSAPSDYYYEDPQLKGKYVSQPQDPLVLSNFETQQSAKATEKQKSEKAEEPKKNESVKKTLTNFTPTSIKISSKIETTTASLKESKPVHGNPERLKMSEKEIDGVNERPSGAILSLTLGMCITAIMITLVGCRLRVVRKRMRRNSKSSYAHDADFLVNGMYL